ncbi:MAG: ABC transporter substrate-binding protein [Campylobacteraceae bacterium]|jgi:branched-chain amino acid transport system substrate-binding protein|nr:ABC transporter substrate-binding protein [Campylobacteraceae bacterium]
MKKILSFIAVMTLCFSASGAKEIKIGAIMPMSGSIAAYGQTAYEGLALANKLEPKLKNGDTVKVVLIDTKGEKVEAANAATRLITSDKVVAIVGELISTNTEQVVSIAETYKVPVVAPAATNDRLTQRREFVSRVCFTDSFQGDVVANYAYKTLGLKSAIVVRDQAQVYSIGLAKAFENVFKQDGGKVLKIISINSGDKDFKAVVSQIKKDNPDMIFLPLYHPEASMFARQAKEAGLNKPLFSGDGVANPTFLELGSSAVEGYMFTDTFDYEAPPTQRSKDFIASYEKESGKKEMASFTALGADSYFLLIDAMNKCEDPSDGVCINKQVKATKNFEGVSGVINMSSNGDPVRSAVIKEVKGGKFVYKATVNP